MQAIDVLSSIVVGILDVEKRLSLSRHTQEDPWFVLNAEKRLIGSVLLQEKRRFVHDAIENTALTTNIVHITFRKLHLKKKKSFCKNQRDYLAHIDIHRRGNLLARGKYEIMETLENGVSQKVSALDFEAVDLAEMVQAAVHGKAKLIIKDSDSLSETAIQVISGEGKKNVVFE